MDIEDNYCPIQVVPAIPSKRGILFLSEKRFEILTDNPQAIWDILSNCTGKDTIDNIAKKSSISTNDIIDIISDLTDLEVVIDSRRQFINSHKLFKSPSEFFYNLTREDVIEIQNKPYHPQKVGKKFEFKKEGKSEIIDLQRGRHSVRNFSDKTLTIDQIGQICDIGYNLRRHSVPSGGGLYPLRLFIIVGKKQDGMPSGYYEYDALLNEFIRYKDADVEMIKYVFSSEQLPYSSSVQIIIAADIERQPKKYGNMGYKLTLIEAGQVAQNITLACQELGLSSCEFGGVLSNQIEKELEFSSNYKSLLGIAIGYESKILQKPIESDFVREEIYNQLIGSDKLVGKTKLITYDDASTFESICYFGEQRNKISGATSTSPELAKFKSVIEAYERSRSEKIHVDLIGSIQSLKDKNYLYPSENNPLTDEQINKMGLTKFDNQIIIPWTKGKKYDGSDIYIPSDFVYYSDDVKKDNLTGKYSQFYLTKKYPKIFWSTSSGVSAFTDTNTAKNKATLELVERDAIMNTWLSKESPGILAPSLLPKHILNRSEFWKSKGRKIVSLLLPSDYAYVVNTIIVSDTYPYFVSGASAGFNLKDCVLKSYEEAEFCLMTAVNHPELPISFKDVQTPGDHGRFYSHKKYLYTLSWLWGGNEITEVPTYCSDFSKLDKTLEIITVDLSEPDNTIKVVRVLSNKLIPISFGLGNECILHHNAPKNINISKLPHYFS